MARWQKATLAGIAVFSLCLCAVAWSADVMRSSRLQDLEREGRVGAHQFANRLKSALDKHRVALLQLASFFENSDAVTEQEFYRFAATTQKLIPPCLRISAVDPRLRISRVYPPDPNRALLGFDVRDHPQGYETILRAMRTKEAVFSPPLQLLGGPQGFVVAAPIFKDGTFQGEVVGSFRSDDFFRTLILPDVLERYEQMVRNSGTPFYASRSFGPPESSVPFAVEQFRLGDVEWEVRMRTRADVVQGRLRSGQAAFWTLGWILSLVAGGLTGAGVFRASAIVSRLKSQGAALRATSERLDGAMRQLLQAEKMTALGELVAGVAHEMNNPLSSIMGYTQLLLGRDLPADIRRRLENVYAESERMAKIVKNLLTFARKHPPEKRHLGLNGVIEKTLDLKQYHFRVNQIRVETALAGDLPMTMLDFHQIQQVLINLLNNAEQAMAERGRGGRIRIATRAAGGRIEARLSDDGPGIPLEIQSHIFEPFFTTKKDEKGTGLGLSLCYGIMQEHGGSIRVESRPGQGATFILELPIIRVPDETSQRAPSDHPAPVPGLRILVIDDEESVTEFLVDLLASKGHKVDTASNVSEALEKISGAGPDLIISDMKMPHGSGKEIYREVLRRAPGLAKRIVFTTGDGASRETLQFIQETGSVLMPKPCKIEEVEGAIARAMRN
jgi:signal transduction histidine kinase/CheY-like chemotaxis protein